MDISPSKPCTPPRKRLLWIAALTIVNIVAFNLFVREDGYGLQGQVIPYSSGMSVRASLTTFLLAFPLVCLIVGGLLAIPYRGRYSGERVMRISSLLLLVVNATLAIGLLFIGGVSFFLPERLEPVDSENDHVHQSQEIEHFVQDINALRDAALVTIEGPGTNTDKELRLTELEQRMDARTLAFSRKAKELRVTQRVGDSLFRDLNDGLRPLLMKFDSLRRAGHE